MVLKVFRLDCYDDDDGENGENGERRNVIFTCEVIKVLISIYNTGIPLLKENNTYRVENGAIVINRTTEQPSLRYIKQCACSL